MRTDWLELFLRPGVSVSDVANSNNKIKMTSNRTTTTTTYFPYFRCRTQNKVFFYLAKNFLLATT